MKIVIVGDGKVGATLTELLSKEGHDIVVIDKNDSVLKKSIEMFDIMIVRGNGASLETLREAEAGSADLLIAATSGDEINILCCITARKLGVKHTIARVRNYEYKEQLKLLKDELGLSMVVNPEYSTAKEISMILQYPSLMKRDSFARGRVEIVEVAIQKGSLLDGRLLNELYELIKLNVLVCAVDRGGDTYIPNGDFKIESGDNIYVTAQSKDLAALIRHLGLVSHVIKDVTIIGGSRIAYHLTKELIYNKIDVKIIENSYERCLQLAEVLPKATIIHGDGSQKEVLNAEGVEYSDAVVTLTNMDEENLIMSMYARHMGVRKTITKINRIEYREVFQDIGIDSIVSPKLLTAAEIVTYVRAMQNTKENSVITLHRIVEGKVEALEFKATEGTRFLNTPLSEINIKSEMLIACIIRSSKIIIPKGKDEIRLDDNVIIVTKAERPINDLNEIYV